MKFNIFKKILAFIILFFMVFFIWILTEPKANAYKEVTCINVSDTEIEKLEFNLRISTWFILVTGVISIAQLSSKKN